MLAKNFLKKFLPLPVEKPINGVATRFIAEKFFYKKAWHVLADVLLYAQQSKDSTQSKQQSESRVAKLVETQLKTEYRS